MFSVWGVYLGIDLLDLMVILCSEAQTSKPPSSSLFPGGDGTQRFPGPTGVPSDGLAVPTTPRGKSVFGEAGLPGERAVV